ncbi:MAG: DUF4130 domain-containing protein [Bacteroidota bacterium]|nr:DUF4130 domain-containing protein [Bacteroidota bacterium]
MDHFKIRYADQKWLIFDCKRKWGIYYDLNEISEVHILLKKAAGFEHAGQQIFHPEEDIIQTLWKGYFNSDNNEVRKNDKLHIQHAKRYWKFLTEKSNREHHFKLNLKSIF